jgi:hypothetical protein
VAQSPNGTPLDLADSSSCHAHPLGDLLQRVSLATSQTEPKAQHALLA